MMRPSQPLLLLLLASLAMELASAGAGSDHDSNFGQCRFFAHFTTARRARRVIVIIALFVALCLALFWLFSRYTEQSYLRKSKKMERMRATEDILKTMVKSMSLEAVNDIVFHGIKPKTETLSVEFENLRTIIPTRKSIVNGFKEEPGKVLLAGVTGELLPGRMAAIMGPSGAGKTTLLNVLCGKIKNGDWQVEGKVLLNNKERDISELAPVTGFVPQDDVVHEGLTVRENIRFSAELRCAKGTTRKELNHITEDVLKVLQLEAQQNIQVGNRTMGAGGLSGGQRKRVNIGLELAACPTLLFLDEPTSGLDSTISLLLCSMLKKMTDLGMTIVMVIHQPRYSLFTLIDDVLLLGKGGQTAYVGSSAGAKPYFESLGFRMPENENPSDWMMDILSGQNIQVENPRMPTKTLPEALFEAWQKREEGEELPQSSPQTQRVGPRRTSLQRSLERGRSVDMRDCRDVIGQNVREHWAKFSPDGGPLDVEGFTSFLSESVGFEIADLDNAEQMVQELMDQANAEARQTQGEYIARDTFAEFLEAFREGNLHGEESLDESESESESGSSDAETGGSGLMHKKSKQGQLERVQTGCCTHFKVVFYRFLVQWWRRMAIRIAFMVIIEFAAMFLGFFDAFIFKSPPWMPTTILNAHISLALLVSVYSLACFSRDQPVYWREASHGLNRFAFMLARITGDSIDVLFMSFFFTATYYSWVLPELNFEVYYIPFLLVSFVASGWGYLVSCVLPPILAPFCAAVLCFMVGGILGLPQKMSVFLDGGILEAIVDLVCFTRWSVPMDFLAYQWCGEINLEEYARKNETLIVAQYHLYMEGYSSSHWEFNTGYTSPWYTGMFALIAMGFVLRFATYPALRFVNADRQR